MTRRTASPRKPIPGSPFNAQREAAAGAIQRFEVGDRVTHDRHGLGKVIEVETDTVVVTFGTQNRRVTLAAGKMHKI